MVGSIKILCIFFGEFWFFAYFEVLAGIFVAVQGFIIHLKLLHKHNTSISTKIQFEGILEFSKHLASRHGLHIKHKSFFFECLP